MEIIKPPIVWRDMGESQVWLQSFSLKAQTGASLEDCLNFADETIHACRMRRSTLQEVTTPQ